MTKTTILAVLTMTLAVAVPASLAQPLQEQGRSGVSGQITVRSTETLIGEDVTNGGVAARGRFTISGVITDTGRVTDYRTVKGATVLIRRTAVGARGAITFLITIQLGGSGPAPWSVTSATRAYQGLHGRGRQVVDRYYETPATFVLKGTVSR
jgi:hypothetical protein